MKGGWTTTASVDYGSGRPANGTPREALPQCAATAPPKTSRGTASYYMARPARGKSTPAWEASSSPARWLERLSCESANDGPFERPSHLF